MMQLSTHPGTKRPSLSTDVIPEGLFPEESYGKQGNLKAKLLVALQVNLKNLSPLSRGLPSG